VPTDVISLNKKKRGASACCFVPLTVSILMKENIKIAK
jgi:hypothetical protein